MKLTKDRLKQIIKEELNEIGYYGLGSEPFGAEKYKKKIKNFKEMLDKVPYRHPDMPKLEQAIKLSVSEILSNIEDEEVKMGVAGIVADSLGTKYLPSGLIGIKELNK
jgi:cytochrome c556